jgi:hypothetical protein
MASIKIAAVIFTLALFSSWTVAQGRNRFALAAANPSLSGLESSNTLTAMPDVPSFSYISSSDSSAIVMSRTKAERKAKSKALGDKLKVHPFSRLAIGLKAGTLGAGVEMATPLARSLNLRATGTFVDFNYVFNIDGIDYSTRVNFRSAQLAIDWFPFHGSFHISPGFLYFNNNLSGDAHVPAGKTFTLSDTTYINTVDDPVLGTATIQYNTHIAPTLTVGFSNIIPRNGKHFSVPFEIGAAYTGAAIMDIKIAGTACTVQGCFNAATDVDTQANLKREIKDINDQVKKVPIFPIISIGLAYRF